MVLSQKRTKRRTSKFVVSNSLYFYIALLEIKAIVAQLAIAAEVLNMPIGLIDLCQTCQPGLKMSF